MGKRIIFVLAICLCSLFLFVGCGSGNQSKTLTPEQAKLKLEKDYNIIFNANNFISMIKSNQTEKVKLFLQAGIDPNTRCMDSTNKTYYGKTVLMIATMLGEVDIVHMLVDDYKADIKAVDNNELNILWSVVDSGKAELVKYFVEKGADVNHIVPRYDNDILCYSVDKNQKEVIKALVENGLDIKARDSKSKTPIMVHAALVKSDEYMIKTLLQLGADINAKDSDGIPALFMALMSVNKSFSTIKTLVDNGADVNFKSNTLNRGMSCLDAATKLNRNNDKQQIIDYLVSHGAK